ncbi:hypothetical protein L2E82_24442 [Cichorium intybus]|uniref:Uncharacterized protein n=1 Tax=Cichorium intybus TaxID=13427 RepID=A0ACB9E1S8_CICIN|nr:hypothetical protein L2E82_24442 [Cichorium intybus]
MREVLLGSVPAMAKVSDFWKQLCIFMEIARVSFKGAMRGLTEVLSVVKLKSKKKRYVFWRRCVKEDRGGLTKVKISLQVYIRFSISDGSFTHYDSISVCFYGCISPLHLIHQTADCFYGCISPTSFSISISRLPISDLRSAQLIISDLRSALWFRYALWLSICSRLRNFKINGICSPIRSLTHLRSAPHSFAIHVVDVRYLVNGSSTSTSVLFFFRAATSASVL